MEAPREVPDNPTEVLPIACVDLVDPPEASIFTGLYGAGCTLGRVDVVGQRWAPPRSLQGNLQVLEGHPR